MSERQRLAGIAVLAVTYAVVIELLRMGLI